MSGRLAGRAALITGAAHGMGEAEAQLFAAEGAKVIVADIDDRGAAVAEAIGDAAMFVKLDVTSKDNWCAAIEQGEAAFGPISILVNNAGLYSGQRLFDADLKSFERLVAVNQLGVLLGMQAIVGSMERAGDGSIVNISSGAGLIGVPQSPVYGMTKWAVRGLTRSSVRPFGRKGIRVNSVYPGVITGTLMNSANDPDYTAELIRSVPLGRAGISMEVARVVLFLASDEAAYVSGAEITVDGGARP
jgi:3alpha(or 20beta)-hydroxysteroid dehydrogenase